MNAADWPPSARSRVVDTGTPTHLLDFGGPDGAPLVLCLHGFGGSALNWGVMAPRLTSDFRVMAPDLVGHGLTPTTDDASVAAVLRQITSLVDGQHPTYLVGSSFGGAMALMVAQQAPELVEAVVLLDAPVPHRPTWSRDPVMTLKRWLISAPGMSSMVRRRTIAMSPRAVVEGQLRSAGSHPALLDKDAVEASVALQELRHTDASAHHAQQQLLRSLLRVFERGSQYSTMAAAVSAPVLWLHGESDPLVVLESARSFARRYPSWDFRTRADAAHVLQLDDPAWVAQMIRSWLPVPVHGNGEVRWS